MHKCLCTRHIILLTALLAKLLRLHNPAQHSCVRLCPLLAQPASLLVAISCATVCTLLHSRAGIFAGSVAPGQHRQSHVATWPTAAADLMGSQPFQTPSAPPASAASSGSAGSFSNKRRKLNLPAVLLPLEHTNTAWPSRQPAIESTDQTSGQEKPASGKDSNAEMASDGEFYLRIATAADPQQDPADSSFTRAAVSPGHCSDQQVPTATPDLLATPEQLLTDAADSIGAEHGSVVGDASPIQDDASSDSLPFRLLGYKGKGIQGPSPLPQYAPEQESKLDRTSKDNLIWWRPDVTSWTFARVRAICRVMPTTVHSVCWAFKEEEVLCHVAVDRIVGLLSECDRS